MKTKIGARCGWNMEERYPYDENFKKVSKYAETHKINKVLKKENKNK